jgi:hypothetical protein
MFNKKVLIAGFFVFVFLGGVSRFVQAITPLNALCKSCDKSVTFCTQGLACTASAANNLHGVYQATVTRKQCQYFKAFSACQDLNPVICKCRPIVNGVYLEYTVDLNRGNACN